MHLLKFSWCLAYTISGFIRQEHLTKQTEIFVKSDCFLSGHSDLFIWNAQFLWFCFCAIVVSWCWCIALFWSESNSSKFIPTWARVKTNLFFVQIVAVLFLIASWRSQYLLFPIFLKVLLSWDTKHSFGLKVFSVFSRACNTLYLTYSETFCKLQWILWTFLCRSSVAYLILNRLPSSEILKVALDWKLSFVCSEPSMGWTL